MRAEQHQHVRRLGRHPGPAVSAADADAAPAQAAQMQARPRAAGGTRLRSSTPKVAATHQQGRSGSPPPVIAHEFARPHMGQTSGGTDGSTAMEGSGSVMAAQS